MRLLAHNGDCREDEVAMILMRKFLVATAMTAALGTFIAEPAYAGGEDQFLGTLMGGAVGGLVGSQFGHGPGRVATTAAGVFVGGLAGNSIGASMDRADSYYSRPAYGGYAPGTSYAEPAYYATNYVPNYVAPEAPPPDPPAAYYDASVGSYCREYTQEIRIDGRVQESYGTACLQPDGTWRVAR
jgi:surface antigen